MTPYVYLGPGWIYKGYTPYNLPAELYIKWVRFKVLADGYWEVFVGDTFKETLDGNMPLATYLTTPDDEGVAQPLPFAGSGGFKLIFGQNGDAGPPPRMLDINTFKTDIYEIIIKKTN